jgi:hypothetical protein
METNDAMEAVNTWQEWFKANRVVAEIDEPGETKDSRECLHDTSKAINKLPITNNHFKQSAIDHFEDVITEFFDDLTAEEIVDSFALAASNHLARLEKNWKKAKEVTAFLNEKLAS